MQLKGYTALGVSNWFNSDCKNSSKGTESFLSFSNSWDDSVIAVIDDKRVFSDRIKTEQSTGITFKGFKINKMEKNTDFIKIYLVDKKVFFSVKVDYKYKFIKLYKVGNSIRVKSTNCITMVY